ncbi:MAG: hypothetical protein KAJ67_10850 [Gemmatimonadetes bacterium]|nr:hypothetical protein [Gemmatimonadota bacterium]
MRTSHFLSLLWLATPLAFGCADQEAPLAPASPLLDVQAGNPVVLSASGSGHIHDEVFGDGELRTFSFTALKHADGTTTGQVQMKARAADFTYHGDVFCLNHIANDLYAVASLDKKKVGDNPPGADPLPGEGAGVWAVRDNGEGANAPPDDFSRIATTTPELAEEVCIDALGFFDVPIEVLEALFIAPIEDGNIQVRSKY